MRNGNGMNAIVSFFPSSKICHQQHRLQNQRTIGCLANFLFLWKIPDENNNVIDYGNAKNISVGIRLSTF
ncbi:hypothetical protein X798_02198 [Onchocerca flexuosa]|uniref:Uncharacterized protein n=1 Tax=Onchocerca flexuosa TaxID=387005 RepID=A0A238C0Y3_9BILA|nr:hypothetical protein X798_02198 [Onchocerca flexuosa]